MPLLDIQRRGQQIGRLRIGEQVETGKVRNGKKITRPSKLTAFRFTTGNRPVADQVAAQLGGQVRQWQRGQYEVYTQADTLMVTIPPRDQVISQDYEMWSGGGCQRRCDSRLERIGNRPCLCPADALERSQLASQNPPQACKPVTRINVMIPDLPGLGVWRLDTSSFYAAVEMGDAAALMEKAREVGVFLPAQLRIDQRERVAGGKTKRYPVPVLEVLASFREIATGQIAQAGIAAQLPPAPSGAKAIEGASERPAAVAAPASPHQPRSQEVTAQGLADQVAVADSRDQMAPLVKLVTAEDLGDDMVCTDKAADVWESLTDYVKARWKQVGAAQRPADEPPLPPEPPADDWPDVPQPGSAA